MKTLWIILAIVALVALALCSGSWVFEFMAIIGEFLVKGIDFCVKGCKFMAKIFNVFGWNKGLL